MNADNPAAHSGQGAVAPAVSAQAQQAAAYQAAQAAHNAAQSRATHQSAAQQPAVQQAAVQQPQAWPQQPAAPVAASTHTASTHAASTHAAASAPATPVAPAHAPAAHSLAASAAQPTAASAPVRASLRTGTHAVAATGAGNTGTVGVKTSSSDPLDDEKSWFARFNPFGKGKGDSSTTSTAHSRAVGSPRRVRAMVTTVDPWSIIKLAFLLSIAAGIVFVVAVGVIWTVLDKMGVFVSINEEITKLFGSESQVKLIQFFARSKWMSAAILLGVINAIIMTALAAIGSMLYNLVVKLVGGVYVTLSDE